MEFKSLDEVEVYETEMGEVFKILPEDIGITYDDPQDTATAPNLDAVMLEKPTIAYRVNTCQVNEDWQVGTIEQAKECLQKYIEDVENFEENRLKELEAEEAFEEEQERQERENVDRE